MFSEKSQDKKWHKFIKDNLLKNKIINGVLLLTKNLDPVYKFGSLENIQQEQFLQFQDVFEYQHTESGKSDSMMKGFELDINSVREKFIIRQCQYHSAYAITKGNKMGVVAVNLPFGILVASHSYPIMSSVAAQHVEDTCMLLRC